MEVQSSPQAMAVGGSDEAVSAATSSVGGGVDSSAQSSSATPTQEAGTAAGETGDHDHAEGLLWWGLSQQPTGLEGESYFPGVVPKVDPVDFHDPGEEEMGNYDLIEDLVTEETYKVARDQALEFYASGDGPRLERARARAARAAQNSRARRRRRSRKGSGTGSGGRTSVSPSWQGSCVEDGNDFGGAGLGHSCARSSDTVGGGDGSSSTSYSSYGGGSSSSSGSGSDSDSENSDRENGYNKKRGSGGGGKGEVREGGRVEGEEEKEKEEEKYWSEAPSGIFASTSCSSSSLCSDSDSGDKSRARTVVAAADSSGAGADLGNGNGNGWGDQGSSTLRTRGPPPAVDRASNGHHSRTDVDATAVTSGVLPNGTAAATKASDRAEVVPEGNGHGMDVEEEEEENEGEEQGSTADTGERPVRGQCALQTPVRRMHPQQRLLGAREDGGEGGRKRAESDGNGSGDGDVDEDEQGNGNSEVGGGRGARCRDDDNRGQEYMGVGQGEEGCRHDSSDEGPDEDGDGDDDDDDDDLDGLGAVKRLGLKAEFMPVAQGAWEDAVCLGDSGDSDAEYRRRRSPAGSRTKYAPVRTDMSLSGDEGNGVGTGGGGGRGGGGGERMDQTRDELDELDNDEVKAKAEAEGERTEKAVGAEARAAEGLSAEGLSAEGVMGVMGGAAENKVARRRAIATASFPAQEGSPWIDPPSVLNPQVDGGGWESQVLVDDTQMLRKPKIPVYLDDPDMLYGALHTPKPILKVLQTEAQQENSHILERTTRRQMATEKQKRLQSAAMKTGYTINTVGDGKSSRLESNIRAVIVRPPHHASPAEDKVLIVPPRSWEDIRNLHRPRMHPHTLLPNQMSIIRLPKKSKHLQGGEQGGVGLGARIGEVVSMPMHREKDLLPIDSRSTFVVVEYVEERPPLLGSTGMASSIITFVRSSSRRPMSGAEAAQNTGAAGFGERRELSPQEDSPFLGEIRPGSEQASICNGLFRAPIFKHHAPDSDFLLIREPLSKREKERNTLNQKQRQQQKLKEKSGKSGKSGKFFFSGDKAGGGSGGGGKGAAGGGATGSAAKAATFRHNQSYVIRPMPVVFLVGQTEPQMEALEPSKPSSKAANVTHLNIVTFLAKRLFDTTKAAQAGNAGIPFKKVLEEAKFLSLPRARDAARTRFKEMVREIGERRDARDDGDGPIGAESLWAAKPDLNMQQVTAQAAKLFRPEDVCALESMVSAWAHLSEVGLDTLTSHDAVAKFLVKIKKRHDSLLAQVKEVRSASAALSKQKSGLARAARAKGQPPPEHDGGLTRRLACMEKLSEVLGAQLTELKRVRAVAQYMHKELQMVPWTLTASYLKRHGISSSPGASLLMLSGMGDPSGCGEGFSYLPRPAEQAKTTASLTTIQKIVAERSVKKVTGTNSDLRRLTMLQLASTCEAMGIPKDTVKTLRRWDRVHMIKELAGVAVAENVKDQNIYARFVRKRRPNATIDKDLYRATCNEIWDRQVLALSATAEEVVDYGSETGKNKAVSKGKGKGKAGKSESKRSATGDDADDDAGGDGGGDEGTASPGGDKDGEVGRERESRGKEEGEGDEQKDDDSNHNDSDDADADADADDGLNVDDLDLSDGDDEDHDEDGLSLSDMEETLEGGDGDGDAPVVKSLQDLNSSSKKNTEELDDERQYRMLQQDLHGDRGDAARWGSGEMLDAAPHGTMSLNVVEARQAQTEELLGQLGGRAELPTHAVRRITRIVGPDGTETVKVSYSLRRMDLVRLDAKGGKKQTALSKGGVGGGGVAGSSPLSFFLPRPQASAESKAAAHEERGAASGQEETVLKIRLKTGVLSGAAVMATEHKKKRRRSTSEGRARKPEENIYAIQRQNSRSTVESRDSRPRNRMRTLLTEIVKKLNERPDSLYFRAPVKRNMYPNYYTKIKKPMDLRTIQDKINSFDYTKTDGLIADMRQLVTNAEIYNGHASKIAQNARDIMADCQAQLEDPEIAEVEAALLAEHQAPSGKKLKTGESGSGSGSGGVGSGGSSGGITSVGKAKAGVTKKKVGASTSIAGTRTAPQGQGGIRNASQDRVSALAASMAAHPPPSTSTSGLVQLGGFSSAQQPTTAFSSSIRPPPKPQTPSIMPPSAGGAVAAAVRPVGAAGRGSGVGGGRGSSTKAGTSEDAGTSSDSDSSGGEEVVEEGGRIGF